MGFLELELGYKRQTHGDSAAVGRSGNAPWEWDSTPFHLCALFPTEDFHPDRLLNSQPSYQKRRGRLQKLVEIGVGVPWVRSAHENAP